MLIKVYDQGNRGFRCNRLFARGFQGVNGVQKCVCNTVSHNIAKLVYLPWTWARLTHHTAVIGKVSINRQRRFVFRVIALGWCLLFMADFQDWTCNRSNAFAYHMWDKDRKKFNMDYSWPAKISLYPSHISLRCVNWPVFCVHILSKLTIKLTSKYVHIANRKMQVYQMMLNLTSPWWY